ncbi:MAG: PKD domain-containing protein [Saprospiraceae bacterium]|nr:PKD domain-containing protein [Saprospiraceae bacterium]
MGAELGPDGRIYIVHSGLGYSTVQYPDRKGKDCKLVHDKPYFGVATGSAIPYMPNYRLGPLDGSPCDTLGLNNIPVANFRVDDTLGFLSRYFYDLSHHEPATWSWNFGDGATSIEQSPLHQFDSAGIYQVCLTVSNQYGSDTHCRTLYLGVSATHNPIPKSQVVVSPNPFRNHLSVALSANFRSPVFNLYDQMGRLARTERLAFGITEIETGILPSGIYFWELRAQGERVKSGKCIKIAE